MMVFVSTLFTAIFVTNILFYKLDGMRFYTQEEKIKNVMLEGLKRLLITFLTTLLVYPINKFVLSPLNIQFFIPLVIIVSVYGFDLVLNLVLKALKKEVSEVHKTDNYVMLNSIIFVATIIAISNTNLVIALGYAVGITLGHLLMMILILTITPKISLPGIPKSFKGVPAILITVGLIAMAFMGLAGIF